MQVLGWSNEFFLCFLTSTEEELKIPPPRTIMERLVKETIAPVGLNPYQAETIYELISSFSVQHSQNQEWMAFIQPWLFAKLNAR